MTHVSFYIKLFSPQSVSETWTDNKKKSDYTRKIKAQDTTKLSKTELDTLKPKYNFLTFLELIKLIYEK